MPILKIEIFQNSKSQKCKLWGQPPPLFGKSLNFDFFFDGFPNITSKTNKEPATVCAPRNKADDAPPHVRPRRHPVEHRHVHRA